MNEVAQKLTGKQKAAIFLLAIGTEAASQIFKNLKEEEVKELTHEIAKLKNVPSKVIQSVVEEFYQMMMARDYVLNGGIDYAQNLLVQALGPEKTERIVRKLLNPSSEEEEISGFERLQEADNDQIISFLQKEHPQIVAVILSKLSPEKAAAILSELPHDMQVDVVYRMARAKRISPELLTEVEKALESQFEADFSQDVGELGGSKKVADILNQASKITERVILDGLVTVDPELVNEIKNLMFTFDDLIKLDDRSIQKVLKEIDMKELSVALKGASDEVKEKIFSNMSERAGRMLQEEMEYLGPVRLKEVEEAQRRILNVVLNLEDSGEIVIPRKGEEGMIV